MNQVESFAQQFHLREEVVRLLLQRGIDSEEKISRYLTAGRQHFSDPFALKGMNEAVSRIREALDSGTRIAIYGDYDADGICSVSILYLALCEHGGSVSWYIPEREEGYGINEEAVRFLRREYDPGLVITCDCGISARAEVAYMQSLGMEVIVTDHHELPPELPDCTVVNPKQDGREETASLCGAGVCLKLVQALFGMDYAYTLVDIAAIATVGDSVELLYENRDIVTEGLKVINVAPREGIRALLEYSKSPTVSSSTLAFTVVPRINAAGRVGEAKRALNLFFEQDEQRIHEVVENLNQANSERQQLCEQMIVELENLPDFHEQLRRNILMFYGADFQAGVTGIVASKLCERYRRPVILFCNADGVYKGSGRSVEGVNLFELLTDCRDVLCKFGGHSQAAGVSVLPENFDKFRLLADAWLEARGFVPSGSEVVYDLELTEEEIDMGLARDLKRMEPFGVGNKRPLFLTRAQSVDVKPMKRHREHLVLKDGSYEITAFHYGAHSEYFTNDYVKEFTLEVDVNEFGGREYLKCLLKSCELDFSESSDREFLLERYMRQLCLPAGELPDFQLYGELEDCEALQARLGTLVVFYNQERYRDFVRSGRYPSFRQVVFQTREVNNTNKAVFSPAEDFPYGSYDRIVLADAPLHTSYLTALRKACGAELWLPEKPVRPDFTGVLLDFSRETFGQYFKKFRRVFPNLIYDGNLRNLYRDFLRAEPYTDFLQFAVCFRTFAELGFLAWSEEGNFVFTEVRRELTQSSYYCRSRALYESQTEKV